MLFDVKKLFNINNENYQQNLLHFFFLIELIYELVGLIIKLFCLW